MTIAPCALPLHLVEGARSEDTCIGTTGLVRLWSEVLEVRDVDADDDFFNLGGNSFLALQILTAVARLTNREFTTRMLYENPTPAAFHARLHAQAAVVASAPAGW
jgi:phthiocerol/phenolphthiocerol synthesis type-I polyketide synthase E